MIGQESIFLDYKDDQKLHIRRINRGPGGTPILFMHGSMEDGKIFYTKSNKGLAPFLAKAGYDCFVLDLPGRGLSSPKLSRDSTYGQHDTINDEIPFFKKAIKEITGQDRMHWVAHSWGGITMLSNMVRYGSEDVISLSTFGTKRRITISGLKKFYMINFGYNGLLVLLTKIFGYLPAKLTGIGAENEPRNTYHEIRHWARKNGKWIDQVDGFNYLEAAKTHSFPPGLFIAAANDPVLGHPKDVHLTMMETVGEAGKYVLLSTENGNLNDYGHINMLTHPDCRKDVFPICLDWIEQHH